MASAARIDMYDRICAGIDFLTDELSPIHVWINQIDLDALDMYTLHKCVIGQLYGSFKYELWAQYGVTGPFSGHRFGFDDENENYDELTEAWKLVISGLRSVI